MLYSALRAGEELPARGMVQSACAAERKQGRGKSFEAAWGAVWPLQAANCSPRKATRPARQHTPQGRTTTSKNTLGLLQVLIGIILKGGVGVFRGGLGCFPMRAVRGCGAGLGNDIRLRRTISPRCARGRYLSLRLRRYPLRGLGGGMRLPRVAHGNESARR